MIGADWFLFAGLVFFVGVISTIFGFSIDLTYPQGNVLRKPAWIRFGTMWACSALGFIVYMACVDHYILHSEWPWYNIFTFLIVLTPFAIVSTIWLPRDLHRADIMDEAFYQKEKAFWEGRAK